MMAAAARHRGRRAAVSATLLAEETGVPLPTAQKLMGRLAAAGPARRPRAAPAAASASPAPAAAISLADIVEAVEGPIAMTTCVEHERHDCALEGACQVRPHMGVGQRRGARRAARASASPASPRCKA